MTKLSIEPAKQVQERDEPTYVLSNYGAISHSNELKRIIIYCIDAVRHLSAVQFLIRLSLLLCVKTIGLACGCAFVYS